MKNLIKLANYLDTSKRYLAATFLDGVLNRYAQTLRGPVKGGLADALTLMGSEGQSLQTQRDTLRAASILFMRQRSDDAVNINEAEKDFNHMFLDKQSINKPVAMSIVAQINEMDKSERGQYTEDLLGMVEFLNNSIEDEQTDLYAQEEEVRQGAKYASFEDMTEDEILDLDTRPSEESFEYHSEESKIETTSEPDNTGHNHTVSFSSDDFKSGEWADKKTSEDNGHTHKVDINKQEYDEIFEDRELVVECSETNNHTHKFKFTTDLEKDVDVDFESDFDLGSLEWT